MNRVKFVFGMFLFVIGTLAYGQSYTFKVLANKGTNEVKSGGVWQPLKTGASLKATDEIKVSSNAYLGLMHKGGKTLEWKESGTFKITDLEAKVSGGSSVASKYADFVLSQMSAESKKNRLSATGAVHRAVTDAEINIHLPNTTSVPLFGEKAILRWDAIEGDNIVYKVVIKDMYEDILITEETTDTFFEVDLSDNKISDLDAFLFTVTTTEDENVKSETYAIKKLQDSDKERVNQGLQELISDINAQTALNKYILAGFYEENNLLLDAVTSYEEAILLAPDVDSYSEAYEEFLLRNGLKK